MEELSLKWDEHHPSVIAVFEELLEKGTLVDCTLAADGQYLKAHKVVLAACSPYFKLLFAQEHEKNPIVVLKDVKFQELKQLIDFVYRGQVKLQQNQLETFIAAAESLQIKGLSCQWKKETLEKTTCQAVPNKDGRTSPVPRKRRRSSPSGSIEECQSVPSPSSNTPGNDCGSNNNVHEDPSTAATFGVPSTSAASCTTEPASCTQTVQKQQGVSDASFLSHDTLSPEEVLPDIPTIVKIEPEEPQPITQVFFPEPKNEEYVDELALLENEDGPQGDTSQQSTNDYPGFSSYDSSGDAFLMTQMTEHNASPGAITSDAPMGLPPVGLAPQQMATGCSFELLPTTAAAAAAAAATTTPAVTAATCVDSVFTGNRSISYTTRSISRANRLRPRVLPAQFASVMPQLPKVENSENHQPPSSAVPVLSQMLQMPQGDPIVQSPALTDHTPSVQAHQNASHKSSDCSKSFCTLSEAETHRLSRTEDQLHKCPICGKAYKEWGHLKLHLRACHVRAEERPYRCSVCESSFSNRSSLISHKRIHEDYRFQCNACQKTFGRSGDLLIHKRLVCLSRGSSV